MCPRLSRSGVWGSACALTHSRTPARTHMRGAAGGVCACARVCVCARACGPEHQLLAVCCSSASCFLLPAYGPPDEVYTCFLTAVLALFLLRGSQCVRACVRACVCVCVRVCVCAALGFGRWFLCFPHVACACVLVHLRVRVRRVKDLMCTCLMTHFVTSRWRSST